MRELVLDASVVAKWFHPEGEAQLDLADRLREEYDRGQLLVIVPPLLPLEILNAAARRWRVSPSDLEALAREMTDLGFTVHPPALERVAHWAGRGLTAYDGCYVALAEERRTIVVTEDDAILRLAGALACSLQAATSPSEA